MNIYLISQGVNDDYDTYDSAVVIAATLDDAQLMHPEGAQWRDGRWSRGGNTWAPPEKVAAQMIGTAGPNDTPNVICASFNAG